jgi:hypothetical protein
MLADAQTPVPGIHVDAQTAQALNAWACRRAHW